MAGTGAVPDAKIRGTGVGVHLPDVPEDAMPDQVAYTRWLAMVDAARNMGLGGTAPILGSQVASGTIGNGPGVGTSGAGTQTNAYGRGFA